MKYRADIDGLRSIAVLFVIFFHYGIPGFSGGFIGVDVFFVLSGYLIGSIIFSQLRQQKFSFSTFYFRRIRRLFPVYALVILATFVAAYWLMLPNNFRDFGQSLLASSVYASNILFYREAGYFDTASHLKPLLHTWSLSVEEQFYIIFPFIAWFTARLSNRHIFTFFSVLTILSMVAAALYIEQDTSAVFYLYPFRAWEMFFGTLLAVGHIPKLRTARMSYIVSFVGLCLIIIPAVWYDNGTVFPGMAAVPPCLGTALLIHAGASYQSTIQKTLAASVPVFIGKISYSLYLWHWPVYVLYAYNKPQGLQAWDTALMASITFIASVASWKYVETPFREGRMPFSGCKPRVFFSTAVMSAICVSLGLYIHVTNGMPNRLDAETLKFAQAAGDLFGDWGNCEEMDNDKLPGIGFCALGDPFSADKYVLVWGDSHAGAYKEGLNSIIDTKETPVLIAWTGGCPPVIGLQKDESVSSKTIDDLCPAHSEAVQRMIATDARIEAVVLVGRWSYYLNGTGVGIDYHNKIRIWPDRPAAEPADQSTYFVSAFWQTLHELNGSDKPVFVVEQVPEFSRFQARELAIGLMNGSDEFERSVSEITTESYANVTHRQEAIQAVLAEAEEQGLITVLRTHKFFCRAQSCSLMLNGYPTYFDNNHVSAFGAKQINHMFLPLLDFLGQPQNVAASR